MKNIKKCNYPAAENIKRIIKKENYKQKKIANLAGYSDQSFSDMLTGRRLIKISDLVNISKALNVDVNDLLKQRKRDIV